MTPHWTRPGERLPEVKGVHKAGGKINPQPCLALYAQRWSGFQQWFILQQRCMDAMHDEACWSSMCEDGRGEQRGGCGGLTALAMGPTQLVFSINTRYLLLQLYLGLGMR